jgi:type II secretory pathway component PulC
MKHPFWILNSTLLLTLFTAVLFILFARVKLPRRQSIEPYDISLEDEKTDQINLEEIYKNDLFKTYQPILPDIETIETEETLPSPPSAVGAQVPETPEVQFFDPLSITLTGIIVQEDDTKNIAIILDNKTQQQINYKVGDEIEDAQIVRILKDKVILIRSNGQQEILYVKQEDAKADNPEQKKIIAKDAVKKIEPLKFLIYQQRTSKVLTLVQKLVKFNKNLLVA